MNETISRWYGLLPFVLLLTGCDIQSSSLRIGLLVLVPFLLIMGVFWWLNLRSVGKDNWDEEHFPDQDDDDDEDHFLM